MSGPYFEPEVAARLEDGIVMLDDLIDTFIAANTSLEHLRRAIANGKLLVAGEYGHQCLEWANVQRWYGEGMPT